MSTSYNTIIVLINAVLDAKPASVIFLLERHTTEMLRYIGWLPFA